MGIFNEMPEDETIRAGCDVLTTTGLVALSTIQVVGSVVHGSLGRTGRWRLDGGASESERNPTEEGTAG